MKKALITTTAIIGVAVLSGCSTAGPFVTSISSDGSGGIIVEKSTVKYNPWTGAISNDQTSTSKIQLK